MRVLDLLAGVGWCLLPAGLVTAIISLILGARRKERAITMIPTSLVLAFLTFVVLAVGDRVLQLTRAVMALFYVLTCQPESSLGSEASATVRVHLTRLRRHLAAVLRDDEVSD
jgi:hypothetical protein